uniref:Uncharacterized protein n=1 Tax=Glossina pallidipes TaxID=7398 RepID=A0A1A9Z6T0_GLOPL
MLGIQDSSQVLITQSYKYFNRVSLKEVSLHEVIKAKNLAQNVNFDKNIITIMHHNTCIGIPSYFTLSIPTIAKAAKQLKLLSRVLLSNFVFGVGRAATTSRGSCTKQN